MYKNRDTLIASPFKKYIRAEGDGGGTQKSLRMVQGEGILKNVRRPIFFKLLILTKHSKYSKQSFRKLCTEDLSNYE